MKIVKVYDPDLKNALLKLQQELERTYGSKFKNCAGYGEYCNKTL